LVGASSIHKCLGSVAGPVRAVAYRLDVGFQILMLDAIFLHEGVDPGEPFSVVVPICWH